MVLNIDDLEKVHQRLIAEYINIIEETSELPFFIDIPSSPLLEEISPSKPKRAKETLKLPPPKKSSRPWVLKPLVKFFVESHIKGKLDQLRASYTLLALNKKSSKMTDKYTWLTEAAEECEKFADILQFSQRIRWLIEIIWPLGIGLLLINVRDYSTALSRIAIILIAFVVYPYLSIFLAFSYKRNRFLHGSIRPIEHFWYSVPEEFSANVYQIEDELFQLLGKKKNREFPVNIFYTIFVALYFGLHLLVSEQHMLMKLLYFIFFFFLSLHFYKIARKRKWS